MTIDLTSLVAAVGQDDPVTIGGLGTRGGPVAGVRTVRAPSGIDWIQPDEMTAACGAATPVDELTAALAEVGQRVVLPPGGTVGGALAVGRSGLRRLGDGPARDALLQARYVGAGGELVKAGGPTVKNVTGFDVCRLLVGSRGTLGFLGDVIVRTRPIAANSQWFRRDADDPTTLFRAIHRPVSMLWDGAAVWVLLEGHHRDVDDQARRSSLTPCAGPPVLPAHRCLVPPGDQVSLGRRLGQGRFVAELGVGVLHVHDAPPPSPVDPGVAALATRIKHQFDPTGRLNPGLVVG